MIFIDEQIPLLDDFRALDPNLTTFRGRTLTREQLVAAGATHLIVRSTTTVNKQLLDGTHVRFVGSATAGIDHIDLEFLSSRDIEFSYAPGSNADAVANYVSQATGYKLRTLGVKLLTLGYGHVGKRVARIAEDMGCSVLISDPPLGMNTPLHELLQQADVLTLHVPLTTTGPYSTYRMIDEQQIEMLKPGAMVINTSRGDVVNERALVRAHAEGKITCILDVFENEPNINTATVETLDLVTPHIAGYTRQAKINGAAMILEAIGGDQRRPEVTGSDQRRLEEIAELFRKEWLQNPTAETFDRIRQESLDM